MNRNSVFLTAFWAGMAAPASLYAATPSYRPIIADLTFSDSLAVVGMFLHQAMAEADNVGQTTSRASEGEQLSFRFP